MKPAAFLLLIATSLISTSAARPKTRDQVRQGARRASYPLPREQKVTQTGCVHDGNHYPPGAVIEYGRPGNRWYKAICGEGGQITEIYKYRTSMTSKHFTTTPFPTTTPPTTVPPGCFYYGQYYPPGTEIESGQDGNWCYWTVCNDYGEIVYYDDFNCGTTTTTLPPTTLPPTTTVPPGCFYNGQYYPPGTEIESGQDGNWCYGTVCDEYGEILYWDDFNCGTTTPPTTIAPTTIPPSAGRCHENGKLYSSGSTVSFERSGNLCFSRICGSGGQISAREWKCDENTYRRKESKDIKDGSNA